MAVLGLKTWEQDMIIRKVLLLEVQEKQNPIGEKTSTRKEDLIGIILSYEQNIR